MDSCLECTMDSLLSLMRENLGDCDAPYLWSDDHLNTAIQLAITQVVNANKEEFTRVVDITLENGTCIQSACNSCEGIIDFPANVNGNCDPPKDEVNDTDVWLNKIYGGLCSDEVQEPYEIESIEVIGDGGCQFRVYPAVPATGTYVLPVACVQFPCLDQGIPPALCRHWSEVLYLALGIALMTEDDRDTLQKSQYWFDLYFKTVQLERQKDQDVFVESIKFGTRINTESE